jgi:hypothetical protein
MRKCAKAYLVTVQPNCTVKKAMSKGIFFVSMLSLYVMCAKSVNSLELISFKKIHL